MDRVNTFSSLDDVNMPYSLEAEQAVLGSVLIDPACITQVQLIVRPEYFYLPQHKAIFTIMQEIDAFGGKIDPLIVLEKLKSEKVYGLNDAIDARIATAIGSAIGGSY